MQTANARSADLPALTPFEQSEFAARIERARHGMRAARLDALLVTTIPAFRYFTGYFPIIAESPARPWFFLLPLEGQPQAIIPAMGVDDMAAASWVAAIDAWSSPNPGDEGVSLVARHIEALDTRFGAIGMELGPETRLGMTAADFERLKGRLRNRAITDAAPLVQGLKAILSPAELSRMQRAADIVGDTFAAVPGLFEHGMSEARLHRLFQAEVLSRGADYVRYLAIGSGPGGYDSICRGPLARAISTGDVLALDTGSVVDGYFCDYDRNFSIGPPSPETARAYAALHLTVEAGIAAARPGVTAASVWRAMALRLTGAGLEAGSIGRMGHGLGMALTEPPSIHPDDQTVLAEGMALAIEPGLLYRDAGGVARLMVHEENIVLTGDGNRLITRRAPEEITVIA